MFRPAHCSSSLFSEKGKKKQNKTLIPRFFFSFFFYSLQHPYPEAAPPSLAAEPRHPGPPTSLLLQRLSAHPPEPLASNSPLQPQPWPKPDPSIRTFKTPCPHGASHTPSQCVLRHKPDHDSLPPVIPIGFLPLVGVSCPVLMRLLAPGFPNTEHLSRTQHKTLERGWDFCCLIKESREGFASWDTSTAKVASPSAITSLLWDLRE